MKRSRAAAQGWKWDLDMIRIVACFLVIMIHVLANTGAETEASVTMDWILYHVFTCAVRCAVPIFFMLSGVLFMDRKISVRQLYGRYILRIVVALAVWSAFYALIDCMRSGDGSLRYFIIRILSRHYHLWYLPAVLGVYICLPVIQKLVQVCPQPLLWYIGAVILVAVVGKTTLDPFLDSFFNTAVWDSFWGDLGLSGVSSGMIFFVLGYYLYRDREKVSVRAGLLWAVGMLCMMSGLDMFFSFRQGEHTGFTGDLLNIWVLVFSSAVFLLLCRGFSGYVPGKRMGVLLQNISECTFGIYLIHAFFLESLYPAMEIKRISHVLFAVMFSCMLFLLSFCAVWCIRRIPCAGKWIV